MTPLSRTDKLVVEELGDDLVVYDEERHVAHRLNATSAIVWRNCDGRRTVSQLAALVTEKTDAPTDDDIVRLALRQLRSAHLVDLGGTRADEPQRIPRRELMRRLKSAAVAAIVLPVVTTIVVPTPAQAASQEGCCACQDGRNGNDTQSENACNQFCGSHGPGSYTWTPGKHWNETSKKCV
jgi:hypothetical protein